MRTTTSFIIQCLSWQAGKPKELDQRFVRIASYPSVADKWTMLVLEVLPEKGELRFTRLSELVEGISQKMLTQTLRQMHYHVKTACHCIRGSCIPTLLHIDSSPLYNRSVSCELAATFVTQWKAYPISTSLICTTG